MLFRNIFLRAVLRGGEADVVETISAMAEAGNNGHTCGYIIGTAFVAKHNDDGHDDSKRHEIMASSVAKDTQVQLDIKDFLYDHYAESTKKTNSLTAVIHSSSATCLSLIRTIGALNGSCALLIHATGAFTGSDTSLVRGALAFGSDASASGAVLLRFRLRFLLSAEASSASGTALFAF